MAYYNPIYNWVVCHPLYNPTSPGVFFIATMSDLSKKSTKEATPQGFRPRPRSGFLSKGGPRTTGARLELDEAE